MEEYIKVAMVNMVTERVFSSSPADMVRKCK
jgi:hypothetical protein